MHRALWWVLGGVRFLMSEVPLYFWCHAEPRVGTGFDTGHGIPPSFDDVQGYLAYETTGLL